ncbi:MAG: hypothetical protein ABIR92_06790, partial [Gemmatimonadaceae bacterium]
PLVPLSTLTTITEIEGFNDAQELPGDGATDNGPLAKLYIVPARWLDTDFRDTWKLTSVLEIAGSATMPNSYKNLDIKSSNITAQYCVYLQYRTAGSKWIGAVAPVANQNCTNPDDAKQLNVGIETEPGTTKYDFPTVVRFDQDKNGKAIIGVTCGERTWCEIGRNNGNAEKRPPVHDGLPGKTKKHLIKAWHDEQELSVPDPTTGKFSRVVRASITPDENLGSYTMLDYTSSTGAVVASIFLETVPPAVARWKWNPLDEDIWIACDQGCCTVSGGQE